MNNFVIGCIFVSLFSLWAATCIGLKYTFWRIDQLQADLKKLRDELMG